MKNKKGLSDVIATVLIVLLALAAIAIVWSFVSPALRNTGASIGASQKCLEADVKPTACSVTSDTVTLQYLKGDVVNVVSILSRTDGSTAVNQTDKGELLSTKTISVAVATGDKVKASATVLDSNGASVTCDPFPIEVACS